MTKSEISEIRRIVRQNGLHHTFIEDEAVDFLACQIQKHQEQGLSFSEALNRVVETAKAQGMFKLKHSLEINHSQFHFSMIRNYLLIATRNFKKYKANTAVNFAGLLIGVFSVIIIGLYVNQEFSYDDFHKDTDRIFRVNTIDTSMGQAFHIGNTSALLRNAMLEEIPQVQMVASLRSVYNNEPLEVKGRYYSNYKVTSAQEDFFKILDFPMKDGKYEPVFQQPNQVIITAAFAEKVFGNDTPLGESIIFKMGQHSLPFAVAGVMNNLPKNTHLNNEWDEFDILISEKTYRAITQYQPEWNINDLANQTYIKLEPDFDLVKTKAQLNDLLQRRAGDELTYTHYFQPLRDIYLNTQGLPIISDGNAIQVYVFALIGTLILVIACINYINLTTARVVMRMKEVGVRKMLGADKGQVLLQFILEAFLISSVAVVLALVLVFWSLPLINSSFDLQLDFSTLANLKLASVMVVLLTVLCLFAGLSSGLYFNKFSPVNLLKAKIALGKRKVSLRRVLVVFQFGISATLIIATLVIVKQLHFMLNKSLGFDKEGVVYVEVPFREMQEKGSTLKDAFGKIPEVSSISLTGSSLGVGQLLYQQIQQTEEGEPAFQFVLPVDFDYVETMGLNLESGRWFDPEIATDMDEGFVVNEAFVKRFGLTNPLGEQLYRNGQAGRIIGVVKDFNYKSLRSDIDPLVMHMMKDYAWNYTNLALKVNTNNGAETIEKMKTAWASVFPNRSFEFDFLDAQIEANYRKDMVFGRVFKSFAFIAITISCLGLLGLVSFSVERRTKEIGVRKVLGASVRNIISLVIKEFSFLILFGFVLAIPAAYYFLTLWLEGFKFRIDMGYLPFVLTAGLVLVIAWLTVSYISFKAAKTNPANVLKQE